jgi:hypothetical protein
MNHTSWFISTHVLSKVVSLPDMQKLVHDIGKHIACGEQHELTMHTEVFDAQVYVILLHGSSIEHKTPGAQY